MDSTFHVSHFAPFRLLVRSARGSHTPLRPSLSRPMNVYLRDKLLQKLEALSDERGYQILDYVEFLDSKYAEPPEEATCRSTASRN